MTTSQARTGQDASPVEVRRSTRSTSTSAAGLLEDVVKPRLRGWLHAAVTPLTLAAGIVLIVSAHGVAGKVSCAIFVASTLLLFGCSATYHLGNWGPRTAGVLRRLDHSNIAIIIAGTYTPLAALALPPSTARVLLIAVWGGALLAIGLRLAWMNAPRWSYVPIYIALGWAALWFTPQFWRHAGPGVVWLILAGGIAYTLGAVVYAQRRPDLWPRWFGFHEVFHSLTVVGISCHFVAVWITAVRT